MSDSEAGQCDPDRGGWCGDATLGASPSLPHHGFSTQDAHPRSRQQILASHRRGWKALSAVWNRILMESHFPTSRHHSEESSRERRAGEERGRNTLRASVACLASKPMSMSDCSFCAKSAILLELCRTSPLCPLFSVLCSCPRSLATTQVSLTAFFHTEVPQCSQGRRSQIE